MEKLGNKLQRFRLLEVLLIAFFGGMPSVQVVDGQTIKVVGSDFAGSALQVNLENSRSIDSYEVDYQMSGSLIGLIKLQEGFADVAFVLQTQDKLPSLDGLTSFPLGFWGIYFAVREENPLSEVNIEGLTEVFRKTQDGLKSEWGTLLPENPKWVNRLLYPTFDIETTDASFPVLVSHFFNNVIPEKFSLMGERVDNPYLAGESNLIVMSKLPEPGKGLRVLSIIQSNQSVGFPPSDESMFFGDYPLRATLHLVVKDPKSAKVQVFVRDFIETNRSKLLERKDLVPAPESVQKQALLEFDLEI